MTTQFDEHSKLISVKYEVHKCCKEGVAITMLKLYIRFINISPDYLLANSEQFYSFEGN